MIRFTGNGAERVKALRIYAHDDFDHLWKSGLMGRGQAYAWLAKAMGLPREKCHMKLMTVEQCELVVELVKQIRTELRPGVRLLGERDWESKDSRIGGEMGELDNLDDFS